MKMQFDLNGKSYESLATAAISLAIPMDFQGPQPNHFGAPKAISKTYAADGFVGDTNRGGSCNVETLTMVPHCNGTHTESVGHIVNQDVYVGHTAGDTLTTAVLITVEPRIWKDVPETDRKETYRPALDSGDLVITASQLENAAATVADGQLADSVNALIVRTISSLPRKSVAYGPKHPPAFLTVQAMEWVVSQGYRHLLLDTPSVDRMYDDGLLTNHHLFWGVAEGQHELNADSRQDKTITEMILVPEEANDGLYLLNLQVPALCTDAAPSRPVIFPTRLL